jgi:hypothetical protein
MFEGPAITIIWLLTPAIVAVGSLGAALAFEAFSKLLASRAREAIIAAALLAAGAGVLGAFAANTYNGQYLHVMSANAVEPEQQASLIAP